MDAVTEPLVQEADPEQLLGAMRKCLRSERSGSFINRVPEQKGKTDPGKS